ncbi:hypothetical protein llg_11300 [Luteolibacter sp. LG18]|nr:hypothetical protein llg_11300 [Luteolibacter sp. LG18]
MRAPAGHQEATAAPAAPVTPILTAEQIFAKIPAPASESLTDKALAAALEKARKKPGTAAMWVNLGDTLAQKLRDTADQSFYDLAEITYQHALGIDPKSVDAMTGMAWVTGGRHTFDQSIEWANKALAVDPNGIAAHGIIGDAALELGNYDQAYQEYQKMMDLRPDLSSWSRGSYLLWICGDRTKAVALMETAIRSGAPFAENTAWCRAKLAMMYFNDGALGAAAQTLEPAIKTDSRNAHVLLAAGKIAAAQHDYPAAIKFYNTLLEAGPNQEALAAIGDLHAIQGEKEEAEKCYTQVESIHANHVATGVHDHTQMAKFFADHDRNPVEALRLAEQHKLTTNVLEADVLAWVYFKSGDLPYAIETMKRALARHTPSPEMHYHAGMIAAAAGDRSSARKHLELALSLNPQFDALQAPIAAKALAQYTTNKASAVNKLPPTASKEDR